MANKRIAAGWWVGAGLTIFSAFLPSAWLPLPVRLTLVAFGIACLAKGAYEQIFHRGETSAAIDPDPDVSLRFQLPRQFVLHNYGGDATRVTIEVPKIEQHVSAIWDGRPIRTPEQTIQFPITDIDRDDSVSIEPIFTHFGIPLGMRTMVGYFQEFIKRRQIETFGVTDGPPEPERTDEEFRSNYAARYDKEREPVDLGIRLTYDARATGRRWEKIETLHYDPSTGVTHVEHGTPREVPPTRT